MSGSVRDTAALIKQQVAAQTDLLAMVQEAAGLLHTAPTENREYWQGEMQGYRLLKTELLRFVRICERAERTLAKGLKRKRWSVQA